METLIITGFTAKSEGVILETNIPARLKPNRMPSKETFVSWDKIGKVLFENYTELEGVASRDSIRNNSSLKEEVEKQYCMPDEVNTKEEHEQYLKDIGHEKYLKGLTAEMFLCNFLNCSRDELQYNISQHPTKVIKAMDEFRSLNAL